MGDFDNVFGEKTKFFLADKPIDFDSVTCISADDRNPLERRWSEFDLNVEIPQFSPFETAFSQDDSEGVWRWLPSLTGEPITLNFTIDAKSAQGLRRMLRCPKLPRKLKKHVKKTYFDEYPKRVNPFMLRFAFAVNNPAKAGKVGLVIGFDLAKGGEQ